MIVPVESLKHFFKNFCWLIEPLDSVVCFAITQKPLLDAYAWHQRLGHASKPVVKQFLQSHFPKLPKGTWWTYFCEQCAISKSIDKQSLGVKYNIPQYEPLQLCVTNVLGPFKKDLNGARFWLTFPEFSKAIGR